MWYMCSAATAMKYIIAVATGKSLTLPTYYRDILLHTHDKPTGRHMVQLFPSLTFPYLFPLHYRAFVAD